MNRLQLSLNGGEKIYFASDFHLGTPNAAASLARENKIIAWLENISSDAKAIFLLGDQFDFWFEYKHMVPKGFTRFIGKLAELRDRNIPIYFFTGNHDMWMFDYFPSELGIPIVRGNLLLEIEGKKLLLGHGDGLGPGDYQYKFLKLFFNSKVCQRLFAFLHPWIGFSIATSWSKSSRLANLKKDEQFMGDKEHIWIFCQETEQKQHHDYYVFGHRHLVIDMPVGNTSRYVNLGEWVTGATYAVFDGEKLELKMA